MHQFWNKIRIQNAQLEKNPLKFFQTKKSQIKFYSNLYFHH